MKLNKIAFVKLFYMFVNVFENFHILFIFLLLLLLFIKNKKEKNDFKKWAHQKHKCLNLNGINIFHNK